MARPDRSALPDGYFHVYGRSTFGGVVFGDGEDRDVYVHGIRVCERRYRWLVHAFALLSTHYHIVIESTRAALSAGMQRLNGGYGRYVNTRYDRFGHVFSERFRSRVIDSEEYLYDACAYVLQNPVRAGLCDRPEDWPWSYSRFEI